MNPRNCCYQDHSSPRHEQQERNKPKIYTHFHMFLQRLRETRSKFVLVKLSGATGSFLKESGRVT